MSTCSCPAPLCEEHSRPPQLANWPAQLLLLASPSLPVAPPHRVLPSQGLITSPQPGPTAVSHLRAALAAPTGVPIRLSPTCKAATCPARLSKSSSPSRRSAAGRALLRLCCPGSGCQTLIPHKGFSASLWPGTPRHSVHAGQRPGAACAGERRLVHPPARATEAAHLHTLLPSPGGRGRSRWPPQGLLGGWSP